jgi:hypothetical protein
MTLPDASHNEVIGLLTVLILGAYAYIWHSFNRLMTQRERDIKSVTDALVGFNGRIDRVLELLAEGGGTRKEDRK